MHIVRSASWVIRLLQILGGIGLMAMMGIVVANVFGRTFFASPFLGTVEIVGLASCVAASCAISLTEFAGQHVTVPLIVSKLSKKPSVILRIIISFLSIGIVVAIAAAGFIVASQRLSEMTPTLNIANVIFRFTWVCGCAVFCFSVLFKLFEDLRKGGINK